MSGIFEVGDLLRIYCKKESNPLWEKGNAAFKMLDPFAREGNLVWVIDEAEPVSTFAGDGRKKSRPDQYLKVRLTNPEKLNPEVFTYLNDGEHQIDERDPITSSGWLLYYDDAIYYLPENSQDFIRQFDKILLEAPERKTNWKVEEHEQTEVKRIIEALNGAWEDYLHDDALNPGGSEYAWRGNMAKSFFFKDLWENGYIERMFNGEYREGNPVYDNIKKYVYNKGLDEGFMPENVEGVLPPTGGGRKKRRKRRKTKTKKSKTKKTRRRKSKKK